MDTTYAIKSERKPRGQGASRRGEILDAAKRLFLDEGFERATIRKIAAAVGVSSTTLYVYFADKDAILRAIAESTFEAMLQRLEESQQGADTDLEQFRQGLIAYITFGLEHPDEYRLLFLAKMMASCGPGRPASPCVDVPAADRSFKILVDGIDRLMQQGIFRPCEPVLAAEIVWASMHGLTALLLDQREHLCSDENTLITALVQLAERGLIATT